MDRFTFLPMGRRRSWLLGAQSLMALLLVVAATLEPAPNDLHLLAAIAFCINLATTFQDVAVDGLAVDLVPAEEQATASGMMFGGQAIGISVGTALCGLLIATLGPAATFLSAATLIAAVAGFVLLLRERPGERRWPLGDGQTHEQNRALEAPRWGAIFSRTARAMLHPLSLLWLPVILVRGFHYGVLSGLTPLIGTGSVGWDEAMVSGTLALGALTAGVTGLTLGSWLGGRLGARRSGVLVFALYAVMALSMWSLRDAWADPWLFRAFIFVWTAIDTTAAVVLLPVSMRLCEQRVAATQFTLYMAIANFGITLGAMVLAQSARFGGLAALFPLLIVVELLAIGLLCFVSFPRKNLHEPTPGQTAMVN